MINLPARRTGYLSIWCNQLLDWCWRNRVLNSQDIVREEMPDGFRLRIVNKVASTVGEGYPWGEEYTFGITDTSETVDEEMVYKLKVWKGKFRRWGDQVYTATDTEVTFSGDGDQYIIWRWSTSGLEIVTIPQTDAPAENDSTYIYGIVHKVNLTDGVFTLLDAVQCGVIHAPIFSAAGA